MPQEEKRRVEDVLPNFPPGPLTHYREQASFDWRKLKLCIEDEEMIYYKYDIWNFLQNNEIFQYPLTTLSLDEQRHLAFKRMKVLRTQDFISIDKIIMNHKIPAANTECIFMYDVDAGIKLMLTYALFTSVIRSLGTEKHYKYIEASDKCQINGCFALTEVAHGSNAKGMKTTATYDVVTKEFILHSCDFTAAKCWVGCLGQCATHAVVYAKLITPNGENQGLHAFVVPIRCTKSLRPFPGVIVGDMGEKIALNGVDNGFLMFNSYHIAAECLLDKLGGVDEHGNYVTSIKDSNKRFGASLGALSSGRIQIAGMATNNIQKAVIIAIRYSASRKQFGPENSEEFPVLEYQHQQIRLFPYVAVTYACRIFFNWFSEIQTTFVIENMLDSRESDMGAKGIEIHALSSASKPIVAWAARDGIQICREACGGHGYLNATGIGKIRNENDANCTYEGENSILIQQTSNWLLTLWNTIEKGGRINSPYKTIDYLAHYKDILSSKLKVTSIHEIMEPGVLLDAYKWLMCYTLKMTFEKQKILQKQGKDSFTVRNEIQSYYAVPLSIIYCEHAILDKFYNFATNVSNLNCKKVLQQLVSLYGAWNLERHCSTLYMGGYFEADAGQLLRDGIIELCSMLKPEILSLVDAISPPDFVLNSVLGNSDGKIYENLQTLFFSSPGSFSRPNWWCEVLNWDTTSVSKL